MTKKKNAGYFHNYFGWIPLSARKPKKNHFLCRGDFWSTNVFLILAYKDTIKKKK